MISRKDFEYTNKGHLENLIEIVIKKREEFKDKITNARYSVIVDMCQPSYRKRFIVFDHETGKVIRKHHVAHGVGSNKSSNNRVYATKFSNVIMSKKTSLGAYVTGKVYYGRYGKSLNLHGLEDTNSRAFVRRIVIHKARYVTDDYILSNGRAGNSWGCLALDPAVYNYIIDLLKGGAFVYVAY